MTISTIDHGNMAEPTEAASVENSLASLGDTTAIVPDVTFHTINVLIFRLITLPPDCDSLVVGEVSAKAFRSIEAERDRRGLRCRLLFLPAIKCLLITVQTGCHEQAHMFLDNFVTSSMVAMGLGKQWAHFGALKFAALTEVLGSGEGDSSGGPRFADDGSCRVWPLLVIEAGATQSMRALRVRARWWFAASDYAMKVVIIVKLLPNSGSIRIEKWTTTAPASHRAGASTTARQASLDHVVVSNWVGPKPFFQTPLVDRVLTHFEVDGAPLVLRFNELMGRDAAAAGEQDVSISEADFQDMAQRVWTVGASVRVQAILA